MMINKVKDTIRRHNLLRQGDRILVGVSGGPDSVALLYLLNGLKKEWGILLHIAHLDHRLRKGSCQDRKFVEDLGRRLKIPVTAAEVNIRKLAKRGSLEEVARNARLGFFFRVAKEVRADAIALGHNLDDQAETVLMRILRGTGLSGLGGILPKRNISGFTVIRPLIEARRKEIEGFLKRKKIKARLDESNLRGLYFRNKIRNNLLPLLEREYNRNIREVLCNMASSASADYDYLMRRAHPAMKRFSGRINLVRFLKLHPAMQRLILRLNISRLKGNSRRLAFRHIKEIEGLILNRPPNSVVDLPQGISVRKKKKSLFFYRR